MPTLVSHTQYVGRTPTVTLSGGSAATDRIIAIMSFTGGDGALATAATINGVSATLVGNDVLSGGAEAAVAVFEMQGVGAGSFATTVTGAPAANERYLWDIYEFSGANAADSFVSTTTGGITTVPFDVTLAANAAAGETVIWAAMASEGGTTGTESVTDNISLLSLQHVTSNPAIAASGYKDLASLNESCTLTFSGMSGGGGGTIDRVTMVAVRVPAGVVPPSLTVTQSELNPGGTISGTYSDYGTVPTTLTLSDGTNTLTIPAPTIDDGAKTFSGTVPALPSSGTAAYIQFLENATVELT